ncbi:hypothetical protein BZA05DRAFT_434947 [Tricharina praecox]|uniref:uncharacterized protein n=1 Tax=Tricharina praecox TaxID=43433 RepID=UPI00221FF55C|nr:uncharacterized protein BZA05DRAFT_434947 [Tricharina praecox]KAI5854711.1 hypothetical protein BZA05DRAFT_434947 [Tricharina praecox]
MWFTTIITIFLVTVAGALVVPNYPSNSDHPFGYDAAYSTEPVRVRKEWRQLTIPQRKDYIRAVKCLHSTPGTYQDLVPSSLTMYEDFAAEHKLRTPFVHVESQFLPWHRYFVWVYENALRKQCGYEGTQPYWDYSLDSHPGELRDSPIFDVEHGFGGAGESVGPFPEMPPGLPTGSGGGCQKDGPFKDWTIHIAVRNFTELRDDRCLTRSINEKVGRNWCTREVEEVVKRQPDYISMYQNLQGALGPYDQYFGLHPCGHFIAGGPKAGADIYLGPVDPLFYLHHANIDRIWWEWQARNIEERTAEITGPLRPQPFLFPEEDYADFPDANITLEWPLEMGRLAGPVKTREVMDIRQNIFNYQYTNPRAQYEDGKEVTDGECPENGTEEFERKVAKLQERWERFKGGPAWGRARGGAPAP